MSKPARRSLPSDIYAVPVTVSVLVQGCGETEEDRREDAKMQAGKWGGTAVREIGEPTQLAEAPRKGRFEA